jgi:hypothetical protein
MKNGLLNFKPKRKDDLVDSQGAVSFGMQPW